MERLRSSIWRRAVGSWVLADPYLRPYLDAQSWITALSGRGPYAADLKEVLRAADRSELVIVVSVLMPIEVLGGSHDSRTAESAERALLALRRSTVAQVAVTSRVVTEARELRPRHGLKSVDAIHLASAAGGRADAFLTNDSKMLSLRQHRGVPVIKPEWPGDRPLDFAEQDDGSLPR